MSNIQTLEDQYRKALLAKRTLLNEVVDFNSQLPIGSKSRVSIATHPGILKAETDRLVARNALLEAYQTRQREQAQAQADKMNSEMGSKVGDKYVPVTADDIIDNDTSFWTRLAGSTNPEKELLKFEYNMSKTPSDELVNKQPEKETVSEPVKVSNALKQLSGETEDTKKLLTTDNTSKTTSTDTSSSSEKNAGVSSKTTTMKAPSVNSEVTPPATPTSVRKQVQPSPYGDIQVGRRADVIPYYDEVSTGPIRADRVSYHGDNGGLQHAAMNALYQPQNAQPSLGELIAFSSIMNGKTKFGGLTDVTATMQNADKMNAYAAQNSIGNEVLRLLGEGRTPEEARHEALTNHLLENGQHRSALAVTMPEYAKFADERAARDADAAVSFGTDYRNNAGLGYIPLGIRAFNHNADGTANVITTQGEAASLPPELLGIGVYGSIAGKGVGSKATAEYLVNDAKQVSKDNAEIRKAELELAKLRAGLGLSNRVPLEEKIALEEYKHRLKQADSASGNTTGFTPKVGY